MRAVTGLPTGIANPQDSSTSDCGHRHPVQHAILSENWANPPARRLLLWQPEELLRVREIVVRARSRRSHPKTPDATAEVESDNVGRLLPQPGGLNLCPLFGQIAAVTRLAELAQRLGIYQFILLQ